MRHPCHTGLLAGDTVLEQGWQGGKGLANRTRRPMCTCCRGLGRRKRYPAAQGSGKAVASCGSDGNPFQQPRDDLPTNQPQRNVKRKLPSGLSCQALKAVLRTRDSRSRCSPAAALQQLCEHRDSACEGAGAQAAIYCSTAARDLPIAQPRELPARPSRWSLQGRGEAHGEKGWGWVGEAFIAALPVLGIN